MPQQAARLRAKRSKAAAIWKRPVKIDYDPCDLVREASIDFQAGLRKAWLR